MAGAFVYVVDDDPQVRESMTFLLEAYELQCLTFPDGQSLLDAVDALGPGCILLDLCMPRRTGLDVQTELARRGSRLPVIAMTAGANPETARRTLAMGAVDLLEKPFAEDALLSALRAGFAQLSGTGERAGVVQRVRP